MLAKLGDISVFDSKDYIYEPKLDGTRAIVYIESQGIRMFNRRNVDIAWRYPEITEELKKLSLKNSVIDGEIVVLENGIPNFYRLQEREHIYSEFKIKLLAKKLPAKIYIFDILAHNDKEVIFEPLLNRKELLESVIPKTSYIENCLFTEAGKTLYKLTREKNMEGIRAKRKNSLYHPGRRTDDWLKLKHFKTIDCIICGYTKGKGIRKETFGALILGAYYKDKLIYLGKVGTGWDERFARFLKSLLDKIKTDTPLFDLKEEIVWTKTIYTCEVQYMELTEDFKLRAPSFKRLREKSPEECVIEV